MLNLIGYSLFAIGGVLLLEQQYFIASLFNLSAFHFFFFNLIKRKEWFAKNFIYAGEPMFQVGQNVEDLKHPGCRSVITTIFVSNGEILYKLLGFANPYKENEIGNPRNY